MEKIAINPERLKGRCQMLGVDIDSLGQQTKISAKTIEKACQGDASLSMKQLDNIAQFLNRSLLFFVDPDPIDEAVVYSPQFRTINNQKPFSSRQIKILIERVEAHRQLYLDLSEELGGSGDLDETITHNWSQRLDLGRHHLTKEAANMVRRWLGITDNLTFDELRTLVAVKGVMVFVSNSYKGAWQIAKETSVRGFALYYETLPVIVIRKQESEGAQAFTLMHELAHLLLHKTSMLDEDDDFYIYKNKEKDANEFASNILITDEALTSINLTDLQNLETRQYDQFLNPFRKRWCISGDAILYRLLREQKVTKAQYQAYKDLKEEQYKGKKAKQGGGRRIRHEEPLHIFGKHYVATVLDSLENKQITLYKACTYLDDLKVHTLRELRSAFVPF